MKLLAAPEDLDRQAKVYSAIKDTDSGNYANTVRTTNPVIPQVQQHASQNIFTLAILLVTSTAFGWTQGAAPATTRALSATEQQLVDSINIASIKETVNALAAEEMQGRGTAQPGGDKAAAYLADRFAKLGLKPLGDKNSYLQPIKFRETQFLPQTAFTAGTESLKLGSDFFVMPPYSGDENVNAKWYSSLTESTFPF